MSESVVSISGDWNAVFAKYIELNRRAFPVVCNMRAKRLAGLAIKHTRKAQLSEVQKLAEMVTVTHSAKTGKAYKKAKRIYTPKPRFVHIYAAELRKQGVDISRMGEQMLTSLAARAFTKRIQGIGVLASGWLPAAKEMPGPAVKTENLKQIGRPKGWYKLAAKHSWKPVATIANEILKAAMKRKKMGDTSRAEAFLVEGMKQAQSYDVKDMLIYIARKMAEIKVK